MNYKVSFCIPEYNCADAACKLVESLLESPCEQIQVVVSDNMSTDGTYERLFRYQDTRLKLIRTSRNVGPRLNWFNALEAGDGEWLYLVMGRDRLNVPQISKLLEMLSRLDSENVGVFYDRKVDNRFGCEIYNNTEDAVYNMQIMDHPTGIVFKREAYRCLSERRASFSTEFTYPEMDIALMILQNNFFVAKGWSGVFTYKTYINKAVFTSNFSISSKERELFFHPLIRARDVIHIINSVRKINLEGEDYLKILRLLLKTYSALFVMWKNGWCEDAENMRHYGCSRRLVEKQEMQKLLIEAKSLFDKNLNGDVEREILIAEFDALNNTINDLSNEKKMYNEKVKRILLGRLIKKCECNGIRRYFDENNIKTVALYGYGDIGVNLCELLLNSGIVVSYVIDNNSRYIYSDLPLYSMNDNLPYVDAVLVTLLENVVSVYKELEKKIDLNRSKLIDIEDLVFAL